MISDKETQYLKQSEKVAYLLVSDGKTLGFKVGGSCWFRQEKIENLLRAEVKWSRGSTE